VRSKALAAGELSRRWALSRAQEGFALVIRCPSWPTGEASSRLAEEFFAVLEARRAHAAGRGDDVLGGIGEGNVERSVFAAQEPGGGEGLEFLAFADFEALADVDEGGYGGIARAEGAGDDGAEVGAATVCGGA
jgi:hypothetical protein